MILWNINISLGLVNGATELVKNFMLKKALRFNYNPI